MIDLSAYELTREDIPDYGNCHHQGSCDDDCQHWLDSNDWEIKDPEKSLRYLRGVGLDTEFKDLDHIALYLLWIRCGDLIDEDISILEW